MVRPGRHVSNPEDRAAKQEHGCPLAYEMWYAGDAKQWVKIREMLSDGVRERELIAYKFATRTTD